MASVLARRRVSPSSRDSLARASLMASALARHRVSPSSLRLPGSKPPSWRRRWLAAESLSLLEIPSQELVVSGRYSIVSDKFFVCLSESLGVESASHQQSLRVQFIDSHKPEVDMKRFRILNFCSEQSLQRLSRGDYDLRLR